ncbi:hypothetical protein ACI782_06980 [Geodermatophilus sp. SYSU D00703]
MGRRKPGKYPYDHTTGDDGRFIDSGVGGTLRVLHGPGRGMGITEGVTCRVEVLGAAGALLDEAWTGKLGKEHRLRRTGAGDRVDVTVTARIGEDSELTASRTEPGRLPPRTTTWTHSPSTPSGRRSTTSTDGTVRVLTCPLVRSHLARVSVAVIAARRRPCGDRP